MWAVVVIVVVGAGQAKTYEPARQVSEQTEGASEKRQDHMAANERSLHL
jgi:hypothetical protein